MINVFIQQDSDRAGHFKGVQDVDRQHMRALFSSLCSMNLVRTVNTLVNIQKNMWRLVLVRDVNGDTETVSLDVEKAKEIVSSLNNEKGE